MKSPISNMNEELNTVVRVFHGEKKIGEGGGGGRQDDHSLVELQHGGHETAILHVWLATSAWLTLRNPLCQSEGAATRRTTLSHCGHDDAVERSYQDSLIEQGKTLSIHAQQGWG